MKQSRLFSYLFCLLALSFVNSLSAQKSISVESFSEIVLTGRLNVELKIADKEEVIIETKGIEVEDIGVNVKGGVLKINALNAFKNKNIETQTDQQGNENKSGFDITQQLIKVIEY